MEIFSLPLVHFMIISRSLNSHCSLLLLADVNHTFIKSDWKAFLFFKEHDLVMALKRTSHASSAVLSSPKSVFSVLFFRSLGTRCLTRTFLLLLGKSINKATGCISGIQREYRRSTKHSLDPHATSGQYGTELGPWHMTAVEIVLHLESE